MDKMTDNTLKFLKPTKKNGRANKKLTEWFDIPPRTEKPRIFEDVEE